MSESELIDKGPCPACGSSDANAVYDDGHTYCFSCHEWTAGGGDAPKQTRKKDKSLLPTGEFKALSARGLTEETCAKWGYSVGEFRGEKVQIAGYRADDGSLIAQKVRFKNKEFTTRGDMKNAGLYGQHLWRTKGKKVVITEGEIDAMSVSQVQQHKWPVVSIPNGAQSAKKSLKNAMDWLGGFDEVVLMFDNDEHGRKAAEECTPLFRPGQCKVAWLPLKDANEMLVAGRGSEIIDAIWNAKEYRPDDIVGIADLMEEALRPIEQGLPWFLDGLTQATHGRRYTEVYGFGAGTGVGKTDFFTQQIAYDVEKLGLKVGVIYLEQPPAETAKRIAGKLRGRCFHTPSAEWTPEELKLALEELEGKVHFYNNFGETEWDVVKARIRYMALAHDIRVFYVDHLTAMANPANERESLETIMKELAMLAMERGLMIHYVSHLATPDGTPHEEGGRVMIRHFKGARAIGFWSYFMFGLERNQQAEDPIERQTTTLRVLKDRYTGQATGETFWLAYDENTGMISECAGCPFADPDCPTSEVNDDGTADF